MVSETMSILESFIGKMSAGKHLPKIAVECIHICWLLLVQCCLTVPGCTGKRYVVLWVGITVSPEQLSGTLLCGKIL